MGTVTAIGTADRNTASTVSAAVERYLSADETNASRNTQRAYASVLEMVRDRLGGARPLAEVAPPELERVLTELWADAAPATWNRNRAVVASWLAWCTETAE